MFRISLSRKSVEPAGWSRASLRFLTACLLSLGQQILQPQKTRGCEFPWYHGCAFAFVYFFFSNGLCGTFPSSGSCWFHGMEAALWLLKRLGGWVGWSNPCIDLGHLILEGATSFGPWGWCAVSPFASHHGALHLLRKLGDLRGKGGRDVVQLQSNVPGRIETDIRIKES